MRHTIVESVGDEVKDGELVKSTSVESIAPDDCGEVGEDEDKQERIPVMIYSPYIQFPTAADSNGVLDLFFSKHGKAIEGYANYIDPRDFTKVYDLGMYVKPYWYPIGAKNAVRIESTTENSKAVNEALQYVEYEVPIVDNSSLVKNLSGETVLRSVYTLLCSIGVPIIDFMSNVNGSSRGPFTEVKCIIADVQSHN